MLIHFDVFLHQLELSFSCVVEGKLANMHCLIGNRRVASGRLQITSEAKILELTYYLVCDSSRFVDISTKVVETETRPIFRSSNNPIPYWLDDRAIKTLNTLRGGLLLLS